MNHAGEDGECGQFIQFLVSFFPLLLFPPNTISLLCFGLSCTTIPEDKPEVFGYFTKAGVFRMTLLQCVLKVPVPWGNVHVLVWVTHGLQCGYLHQHGSSLPTGGKCLPHSYLPWMAHKYLLWFLGHLIPFLPHHRCFRVISHTFFPTHSSLFFHFLILNVFS